MRDDIETYTITITDGMCQLVAEALVNLFKSEKYDYDVDKNETIRTIMEQFRNLGSRKIPEVYEVHIVNKNSVDVIKRESIKGLPSQDSVM
jgi:hypothetical protein